MNRPPLNPSQAASADQFHRQSARYGASHPLADTSDLRRALPHLRPQVGQTLLDLACGAGHAGAFFGRLGLRVTFADIAPGMLEQARALAQADGFPADFLLAPAESLPCPDASFDFLTCRVAAHHFSCPASFAMQAARVLKPGGLLLLIDGTVEDGYPVAEAWAHEVEKLRDPTHGRLIRPSQWIHLTGHVGLPTVHHEIFPLLQPDLDWYFDTADTPPANRQAVRTLVANAPAQARDLFNIAQTTDGKWTWWWQRLILIARKPGSPG